MALVSTNFTDVGSGQPILVQHKGTFKYRVSGTFVATVLLEKSVNGGQSYETVASLTAATSALLTLESPNRAPAFYRFTCSSFTSGTVVTSLNDVDAAQLTDGLTVSGGKRTRFYPFPPATLTSGTSTTPSTTTVYLSEIYIPMNALLTGIAVSNGGTAGTDKYIVALIDAQGNVVATSNLAGTTTAGTDVYQSIAFTAPYLVKGPGVYYIGLYVNGTTDRFRTIPAAGAYGGAHGSATGQVFGTIVPVTLPTTFTADKGPVAFTY